MPNPHFKITIVKRSKGQSAVAGAAYQSGESLFCEYDQKRKSYTEKRGIAYTEIMLPSNAPPEFADRATLWNAVEAVENQWNSQLARRFVLALPREIPKEQYPQMVREYCQEYFVSKGMCCDFAIHDPDPPGHNPHCHIMLTLRAMDENGKWLPKSRKVYDLDENGERIRLPSGNWKSYKEDTVDWNQQSHCEEWRHGWEVIQNRYLEMQGRPERIDLRSYERQGIDVVPTVHMGPAVTQMERKGISTNVGNLNRDIKAANSLMASIRKTIKNLRDWINDLIEKKSKLSENENSSPNLLKLLMDYTKLRAEERSEWSAYGQQQGKLKDMKAVSSAIVYLKHYNIVTLDELEQVLDEKNAKATEIRKSMRRKESRMKTIASTEKAVSVVKQYKSVHDKYIKIGWKGKQKRFAENHSTELAAYNKADRYLRKQNIDVSIDLKSLKAEYRKLETEVSEQQKELEIVKKDLQPLKDVRYWVNKVIASKEQPAEHIPEPKHSLIEKLKYIGDVEKSDSTERNQQKKQDIDR
ncbi:MAG: MobA/MobL family protein [Oscillospiraceae bacterium]|nr:MobA/MobL family protein [Oscillospiraceae bacterium]